MSPSDILAQLRVTMPDGTEQIVPVTEAEFNIGRVQENELQLSEGMVSRHHARLLFEGDRVNLIDLKSSNGTMVGDLRLPPNEPYPILLTFHLQLYPSTPYLRPLDMTFLNTSQALSIQNHWAYASHQDKHLEFDLD